MKKQKTNEGYLKDLYNSLTTIEAALLRERIKAIADITRNTIAKNPEPFRTPVTNEHTYIALCDKIDKCLYPNEIKK